MRWLGAVAAVLGVAGCAGEVGPRPAPTARPTPYTGPLRLSPATTSSFVPEKLPIVDPGPCAGLVDVDGDGQLHVVAVRARKLQLLRAAAPGWALQEVPLAGLEQENDLGCAAADFDGDGRLDFAVAGGAAGVIAFREADGTYTSVPLPPLPQSVTRAFATSLATIDADGDGRMDLYIARSVGGGAALFVGDGCLVDARGGVECGDQTREYGGAPNVLLRNLGNRAFALLAGSGTEDRRQTQAVGVFDLDGDGRQDLFVCNDGALNAALLSRGDGTFSDATVALGLNQWNHCMGVAHGDLDGDGRADLATTNVGLPLVLSRGAAKFQLVGRERGLNPIGAWGWGIEAEDLDNDGDLDVLSENYLIPPSEWSALCPGCALDNLPQAELFVLRNNGEGYFSADVPVALPANASPRAESIGSGEGGGGEVLVVADHNGDGVLDALVLRRAESGQGNEAWLLRGQLARPAGSAAVDAPQGAVVEVCVGAWCRKREVAGGGSFRAMRPNRLHFGLGANTSAVVRVEWPKGTVHELGVVPAGQRVSWLASSPLTSPQR